MVIPPTAWRGLADTIDLLGSAAPALGARLAPLRRRLEVAPSTLGAAALLATAAQEAIRELSAEPQELGDEARRWLGALSAQCRDTLTLPLATFTPWIGLLGSTRAQRAAPSLRADMAIPTLRGVAALGLLLEPEGGPEAALLRESSEAAEACIRSAAELSERAEAFALVDYDFLYDTARHLFSIGYNVSDHRRDAGCYDLLASEARIVSYVAVAQGEVPQAHWFALGRLVTSFRNEAALLSWSGSMFEYLMPLLVMPTFPGTLLHQTYRTVVRRQIEYGQQLGIPWGVSEAGYNTTDAHLNYQYRAFGVPGLGFKRGLAEDRVIAPYATAMALMVDPEAALANLSRMRELGFEGQYGFYEAIDYTPSRLAQGQTHAVIQSYMAHHQGMSLLSIVYALLDRPCSGASSPAPASRRRSSSSTSGSPSWPPSIPTPGR
jgi:hypothetical protein